MKFSLQPHCTNTHDVLSPSLQVSGLDCSRRQWLMYYHFATEENQFWRQKTDSLKSNLTEAWIEKWRFDCKLPSGSIIDVWIPNEAVFVEYKTNKPSPNDLYQVWMKQEELQSLSVTGMEYQLWYLAEWGDSAKELTNDFDLNSGTNAAGFYAIATNKPDAEFKHRRKLDTVNMLDKLKKKQPPNPKFLDARPCLLCRYRDFCYI